MFQYLPMETSIVVGGKEGNMILPSSYHLLEAKSLKNSEEGENSMESE